MKKLRIALGVQLFFFAAWGAYLLASRNTDSPEFYLETVPVDPRDLISGTYVALSYATSNPQPPACQAALAARRTFYVKLESRGRTAVTERGQAQLYEAADCTTETPLQPGWARAEARYAFGGRSAANYGIERFFLNENDPRKDARSGAVLAKVKIDRNRRLVLLDLVKKI